MLSFHEDNDFDLDTANPAHDIIKIDAMRSGHTCAVPFMLTETITVPAVQEGVDAAIAYDLDSIAQIFRRYIDENPLGLYFPEPKTESIGDDVVPLTAAYCVIHWQLIKDEERKIDQDNHRTLIFKIAGEATWGGGH